MLVRRVPRLSGDDLAEACATLLSEAGRVQTFPDGLVVVGDRVAVLQRVHELLDSIERAPVGTWVVQLYVVNVNQSAGATIGLDAQPALDLAAAFSAASAGGPSATAEAVIGLRGALEAVRREDASSLVAEPLFLLVDGGRSKIERGERIPVARKTVSDQAPCRPSITTSFKRAWWCSSRFANPVSIRRCWTSSFRFPTSAVTRQVAKCQSSIGKRTSRARRFIPAACICSVLSIAPRAPMVSRPGCRMGKARSRRQQGCNCGRGRIVWRRSAEQGRAGFRDNGKRVLARSLNIERTR